MLLIECPWCGPRTEEEFWCGGESHIVRPTLSLDISDAKWAKYLYYRKNTKGVEFERWLHRYGCGQWFNVARDTVTHEIKAVYGMAEEKPQIGGTK